MAQCVRDDRVVLWDRRRDTIYDDAGVRAKWGVPPASVPDRLALVGDAATASRGSPAGATSRRRRSSPATATSRTSRERRGLGRPAACAIPVGLAATLRDQMDLALLFRDLARLRTTADGVSIPQADVEELRWARRRPRGVGGLLRRVGPRAPAGTSPPLARVSDAATLRDRPSGSPRTGAAAPRGEPAARRRCRTRGSPCRTSNHVPPAVSVTIAPARSAMSPAAATSHADIPPDWMNASNRPFATYASASADEPIVRDTRIALRTACARVATARPPSARCTTASLSSSLAEARISVVAQPCRAVRDGRERLAAHRVVDRAGRGTSVDHEPDRHAEERDPVRVVHGAVERVHDPRPARRERAGRVGGRRDPRRDPCAPRTPRRGSRHPGTAGGSRPGSAPPTGGRPRSRRPSRT